MEADQRIQALEQEVQILKTQIQSILLDIQTHLLTNTYPALRDHHTSSSSAEDDEDDDEYDRAAPAPKVRKVANNNAAAKREKAAPPPAPKGPVLASLDEQQDWVLQNIQQFGIKRTRELIDEYAANRHFSPEVSDTLLRFTDMYAAAAEVPTLPTRPEGMPAVPVTVRPVSAAPQQPLRTYTPPQQPAQQPIVPEPQPRRIKPTHSADPVRPPQSAPMAAPVPMTEPPVRTVHMPSEPTNTEDVGEPSSLVLRLIAGVQNAGAGVRWGKKED